MLKRVAMIAAGFGMAITTAEAEGNYRGYEAPPYTVERQVEDAELRLYDSHILAVVTVRGPQAGALNQGFRVLAGYIFGGNTASDKVAMTAPVAQSAAETIAMTAPVGQTGDGDLWTVSFMMPRAYTLDTLPVPTSDAVRFIQTDPERRIVLRFSGRTPTETLNAEAARLRQIAERAGISLRGAAQFAFYDDPFTLPWNRRNEVSYVVGTASSKSPG